MNVIEKIKNSIESVTSLTFYYDTPQTLNQRLDSATYPCAMLNIVQSGAIVTDNGIIRERLTVESQAWPSSLKAKISQGRLMNSTPRWLWRTPLQPSTKRRGKSPKPSTRRTDGWKSGQHF